MERPLYLGDWHEVDPTHGFPASLIDPGAFPAKVYDGSVVLKTPKTPWASGFPPAPFSNASSIPGCLPKSNLSRRGVGRRSFSSSCQQPNVYFLVWHFFFLISSPETTKQKKIVCLERQTSPAPKFQLPSGSTAEATLTLRAFNLHFPHTVTSLGFRNPNITPFCCFGSFSSKKVATSMTTLRPLFLFSTKGLGFSLLTLSSHCSPCFLLGQILVCVLVYVSIQTNHILGICPPKPGSCRRVVMQNQPAWIGPR